MQGALCWGQVDALVEILVDNKYKLSTFGSTTARSYNSGTGLYETSVLQVISPSLPATAAGAGTGFTIAASNLFGGKDLEGGVAGTLRFYFGSTSQGANGYLTTEVRNPFPAYKGLCYAVWEQVYLGTVPYLKHWHFVLRRCPTALGVLAGDTTKSRIGDDANPAEVLWDLYTDARWGLARSSANLDQASFLAALTTLKTEGCGISGQITPESAEENVKEILRHIDGVLVTDPVTGLLRLKLIRADYTVADLPVFNRSNIAELQHTRPQMPELLTEIKVNFIDRSADYTQRTRAAYNQALRQVLGRAQGATQSYLLFSTGANAERAAVRDLHAHSSEFASGTMVANRAAAVLAPGDPFVINDPDEGLSSVVCRATKVDYGTIHDQEPVTVQWVEDVFGSQGGVYETTPAEEWTEPAGTTAGQRFDVETEVDLDDTQGCLTLRITGDVSAITLVETQTQEGGQDASGWVTQSNAAPITVCVNRAEQEVGRIAYRITFTQPDSTTDTIEDEIEVPPRGIPAMTGTMRVLKTIIADPPGVRTVLENFPLALTDLGEEHHHLVDLTNAERVALSGVVLAAGAGALREQYLRPSDSTWRYLDGAGGPSMPMTATGRITSVGVVPESTARGSVWCRLVAVGGNDSDIVKVGHVALTGGASPTAGGGDDDDDDDGGDGQVWDWNPTEGSGSTITDKNGSGADLSTNGIWGTNVVGYQNTGIHTFTHAFVNSDDLILAPRSTFLMYFKAPAGFVVGTTGGWLGRRNPPPGGWVSDHRIVVNSANGKFHVTVHVDSSGSPANSDVDLASTTVIAPNGEYVVGLTHDGATLKLWVNGVVENSASAGSSAIPATGRYIIVGGGSKPFAVEHPLEPGGHITWIGRVIAANRAFSASEMAATYAEFQAQYPGLP
jgi:hypothetical protein